MNITDSEYLRLKAIEAAHARAVDVQSKWRAAAAVTKNGMHLDLLNELRGALMNQESTQPYTQRMATNCPPHVVSPDGKYCIDCGLVL